MSHVTKYIQVTMKDGSSWLIPAQIVAVAKANFDADQIETDNEELLDQYRLSQTEQALANPTALIEFARNWMKWEDVQGKAVQLRKPVYFDYSDEWDSADMNIVEHPASMVGDGQRPS